jgi:hypothetical protein
MCDACQHAFRGARGDCQDSDEKKARRRMHGQSWLRSSAAAVSSVAMSCRRCCAAAPGCVSRSAIRACLVPAPARRAGPDAVRRRRRDASPTHRARSQGSGCGDQSGRRPVRRFRSGARRRRAHVAAGGKAAAGVETLVHMSAIGADPERHRPMAAARAMARRRCARRSRARDDLRPRSSSAARTSSSTALPAMIANGAGDPGAARAGEVPAGLRRRRRRRRRRRGASDAAAGRRSSWAGRRC